MSSLNTGGSGVAMRTPEPDLILTTGSGICAVTVTQELTSDLAELAEHAWIKSLRTLRVDGVPLRDRFRYRGDSLWWFAEVYLHRMRVVHAIHRAILAVDAALARERPRAVRVVTRDPVVRHVAAEICRRDSVPCDTQQAGWRAREVWAIRARAHYHVWRARLAALSARERQPAGDVTVAAFVHSAFWRGGTKEQYVGPVLRELGARLPAHAMVSVGLGPRTSYRARTWRRRLADAGSLVADGQPPDSIDTYAPPRRLRESQAVWATRRVVLNALRGSADLRHAALIRGCDTWPLVEPLWWGIAYLQFPWSAHVMDQLGAALDATRPRVAVTYAEAGGWGRALVLEARRRSIPTVGLQHGFIYRHWMNYHHEPDEMAPSPNHGDDLGFPAPTLTLLYDQFAADHLMQVGHFAPERLRVTGSPGLDELAVTARTLTEADLVRARRDAGVPEGRRAILVAAKFTQIAGVFPVLVRALAEVPDAHLVVKCHPSEGPDVYVAAAGGSSSVTIAPATLGLAVLTKASDLLVTVNSTAAIEAMVLGVPTLVLALPNNLSPFVDAGVMDGVVAGGDVAAALRRALDTGARREAWRVRAASFMQQAGIRADGLAVARAADAILGLGIGD
jgi:hypothetical protein